MIFLFLFVGDGAHCPIVLLRHVLLARQWIQKSLLIEYFDLLELELVQFSN